MEPPATTEGEWWRHHSSPGHKAGTLAMPGSGVSGRKVSFKVLCLAAVPSRVCRTPQASFRSREVPELRVGGFVTPASVEWYMCSTGRSAAGSVLMRDEKQLLSRRARVAERMCCGFTASDGGHPSGVAEGATEGDGYTRTCGQSGAIAVRATLMDIPKHSAWGHRVDIPRCARTGAITRWAYSGRCAGVGLAVW